MVTHRDEGKTIAIGKVTKLLTDAQVEDISNQMADKLNTADA
jgi:hypothetical protein